MCRWRVASFTLKLAGYVRERWLDYVRHVDRKSQPANQNECLEFESVETYTSTN